MSDKITPKPHSPQGTSPLAAQPNTKNSVSVGEKKGPPFAQDSSNRTQQAATDQNLLTRTVTVPRDFFSEVETLINTINNNEKSKEQKTDAANKLTKLEDELKGFLKDPLATSPQNARQALEAIEMDRQLAEMDKQINIINTTPRNNKQTTAIRETAKKGINAFEDKITDISNAKKRVEVLWHTLGIQDILTGEEFEPGKTWHKITNTLTSLKNEFQSWPTLKTTFLATFNGALTKEKLVAETIKKDQAQLSEQIKDLDITINSTTAAIQTAQTHANNAEKTVQTCVDTLKNSQSKLETLKTEQNTLNTTLTAEKSRQNEQRKIEAGRKGEQFQEFKFTEEEYKKCEAEKDYALEVAAFKMEHAEIGKAADQANAILTQKVKARPAGVRDLLSTKDELFFKAIATQKIDADNIAKKISTNTSNPALASALTKQRALYTNSFNPLNAYDKTLVEIAEKALLAEEAKRSEQSDHDKELTTLIKRAPSGFPQLPENRNGLRYTSTTLLSQITNNQYSQKAAEAHKRFGELKAIKDLTDAYNQKTKEIATQERNIKQNQTALAAAERDQKASDLALQTAQTNFKQLEEQKAECEKAAKTLEEEKLPLAKELEKISNSIY